MVREDKIAVHPIVLSYFSLVLNFHSASPYHIQVAIVKNVFYRQIEFGRKKNYSVEMGAEFESFPFGEIRNHLRAKTHVQSFCFVYGTRRRARFQVGHIVSVRQNSRRMLFGTHLSSF